MSKKQFLEENLRPGEIYAGLLLGVNGAPDQHIFLLPGAAEKLTFDQAVKWAAKAGGHLPTRREQSLLFANAKEAFEPAWYWSDEQHASYADCAWGQFFGLGGQYVDRKSYQYRARAVRRLAI